MALLTLIKEVPETDLFNLCLHFIKNRTGLEKPQIQYGEIFCFEEKDKKYTGFMTALYALIRFFKCFDFLFNKDEDKVSENEEFLFHLEKSNLQIDDAQLKKLNNLLYSQSFIISEKHISIADIFCFVILYKWMEKTTAKEKKEYIGISRWFLYLQELLLNGCDFMKKIDFEESLQKTVLSNAPNIDGAKDIKKKEGEKRENEVMKQKEKNKKGAKEKKGEKINNENAKATEPARAFDDITRLNIIVGYVEEVDTHPDADNLYCLKVNVGEENLRDICSGLRKKKEMSDLLHRYVLVLANLKAKTLRGKKSYGMILCGSDDNQIELLKPPSGVKIGERIICENCDSTLLPDKALSSDKDKNPFFHIQPYLMLKNGVAYYKNSKLLSSQGEITCALNEGSIS